MKQVDVLTVLEECGAYVDDAAQFPEQFKAGVVKRHQREYAAARAAVAESLAALERIVSYYDLRRHNGRLPSFDSQAECEHEATMFGEARGALARCGVAR